MDTFRDHDPSAAILPPPLPEEPVWFALRPEVRSGALRFSELRHLAEQQQLRPDDLVWRHGWTSWFPAYQVQGLLPPVRTQIEPPAAPHHSTSPSRTAARQSVKERAQHEFRAYLVISTYIWAVLTLLRLHERVLAGTYGFSVANEGWTVVTALILGKVVLIAEMLRAGEYVARRVPALGIVLKALIFASAILLFHLGEHLVIEAWNGRSLAEAIGLPSTDAIAKDLMKIGLMAIALIPYFLIKEIEKRTGQTDLILIAVGLKR